MHVRLAFSIAAHLKPDILLVDEVLAVGDVEFQKICIGRMKDIAGEGRTVLFVSHNMSAINRLCTRAIHFKSGIYEMDGDVGSVIENYLGNELRATGLWKKVEEHSINGDGDLIQAKVVNTIGTHSPIINFDIGFGIEIVYRATKKDISFVIALRITDSMGIDVLTTWDRDNLPNRKTEAGKIYVETCRVPGKLLRPGTYIATAMIRTMQNGTVESIESASFNFEVSEVGYAFNRERFGIITPLLEWNIRELYY